MMKRMLVGAGVVVALLCTFAFADSKDVSYQDGKILSVTKLPSAGISNTDSPTPNPQDRYDIKVQVGDKIYKCRYSVAPGEDISWINGKTGQVRVKGKVLYAKRANGTEAKARILSESTAPNP